MMNTGRDSLVSLVANIQFVLSTCFEYTLVLIPQAPYERTAFHLGTVSNTCLWCTSCPLFKCVAGADTECFKEMDSISTGASCVSFKSHRSHELLILRVLRSCAGGEYASFSLVSNVP